jgi:hypothetical protein
MTERSQCTWRDDCTCTRCTEVRSWGFCELVYRDDGRCASGGSIAPTFTGTSREALQRARELAKERGASITYYIVGLEREGSIIVHPWDR